MNVALFHRRRAERLAQLIDEPGSLVTGHHLGRSALDDELAALVSLTRRVSDLPMTAEAHPEFREGLRAVLMATIEREGIGITAKPEEQTDGMSRLAAVAAEAERRRARIRTRIFGSAVASLAASALAISGVSVASGNALPGQALYGVKRSTERAQLAWTGSDNDKAQLYLDFAATRLDEAKSVVDDPGELEKIIGDWQDDAAEGARLFNTAAVEAGDAALLDPVDAFVDDARPAMARLAKQVSAQSLPLIKDATALLGRIAARSTALRPTLSCRASTTDQSDDLGPIAGEPCTSTGGTTSTGATGGSAQPSTAPATPTGTPTQQPTGAQGQNGTGTPTTTPTGDPSSTVSGGSLIGDLHHDLGNLLPTN